MTGTTGTASTISGMTGLAGAMTDWETWQHFFESRRGNMFSGKQAANTPVGVGALREPSPMYVVVAGGAQNAEKIICAYGELDDLADWSGRSLGELRAEYAHRDFIVMDRDAVDQGVGQGLALPHLLDQTRELQSSVVFRTTSTPVRGREKEKSLADWAVEPHFVLKGLESWWSRVLPSGFGLYVHVRPEGGAALDRGEHILVVVRGGRIEAFGEPDLSSLSRERRGDLSQVAKYLSETALVPIQAIEVDQSEWLAWATCSERGGNAWRLVAQAVRKNRAQLVPFRWPVVCLVSARAWFQI